MYVCLLVFIALDQKRYDYHVISLRADLVYFRIFLDPIFPINLMLELKFLITKRTITVQVISENLVAKEWITSRLYKKSYKEDTSLQGTPANYATNNSLNIQYKYLINHFNLLGSGYIIVEHYQIWLSCLFN